MIGDPIRKIVIVGGGTAGWMAAAALSKVMGQFPGLAIELVESEAIGTVGVGEATIPQINLFNAMLGVDESEFVRETHATYKLGIEFVDWTRLGHRYVHPFGSYGPDMMGIEFHHHWLKGRSLGDSSELDEYSIAVAAGKAGKMAWPARDNPRSPLSKLAYAFQFDAGRYARYLRGRAERQGVKRTEGRITSVERDGESGFVTAVVLESGARVEGELFIDCSGFRALLIGQELGVPFTDWSEWLPCDRAVAIPCTLAGDRETLTRSTARPAGWQWRIPLQHRIGNGHVYCSQYMSEDEATGLLLANLDGEPLAEPNQLRFTAGRRARAWEKNVVALGLAGGFLEPLESTAIHLVQAAIARLLALFPSRAFGTREIERFNDETLRDYVDIRDFLLLHYNATKRDDSPFWDYCRNLAPPKGLAEKLAMFRSSGRIFREHNELFTETSWLSVLVGQGVEAGGYHPAADLLPDAETRKRLAHIREVVAQTAQQMPTQDQFLAANGSAIPADERRIA
ncbi:tryptophan halogenase family protein [Croceibacterium aestuarii]|uniref:tryptophan halogenase family protein n=1 Tax=Croceibacterium aestuarii TaxID=3064139 RepID=UPI00272DEA47|nr:tryptophan halogenase family protein [Croceibacterium sp. D39]